MSGPAVSTPQGSAWQIARDAELAILSLDVVARPVNVLSSDRLRELSAALDAVLTEPATRGILIRSGKPRHFAAGADLKEIDAAREASDLVPMIRLGQELFARLAGLAVPVCVAATGVCVGGALELALAADRIVVADDAAVQLGLPEVRLGLVPGWGGTWRLPRRLGLATGLEWLLSARVAGSAEALAAGLVDQVEPPDRVDAAARAWLRSCSGKPPSRPALPASAADGLAEEELAEPAARAVRAAALAGVRLGPLAAEAEECQSLSTLAVSEASRALRRAFFAARAKPA